MKVIFLMILLYIFSKPCSEIESILGLVLLYLIFKPSHEYNRRFYVVACNVPEGAMRQLPDPNGTRRKDL